MKGRREGSGRGKREESERAGIGQVKRGEGERVQGGSGLDRLSEGKERGFREGQDWTG